MSTPERPGIEPEELRRRTYKIVVFLIGYAAIWIAIGFVLALVVA